MNLKDFIKLVGQQGKVVVVGEDGNVKGIFLPYDDYQKMSGGKSHDQQQEDLTEKVNREILQAQLEEVIASSDGGTATSAISPPERIDSLLNKRAQDLFKSVPHNVAMPYNFTAQPDVSTSASDEEIKPNFDDI